MKIHALNKHSFTISTCFFFILALCLSSAVLSLSTHVVMLQVSLWFIQCMAKYLVISTLIPFCSCGALGAATDS